MGNSKKSRGSDLSPDEKSRLDNLGVRTVAQLQQLGAASDSKCIVAVSGGPDSLALAHALHSNSSIHLVLAHVNHGLRPNATHDEQVVRQYATEWGVPLYVREVDTDAIAKSSKKGIEETARALRYEFFEELSTQLDISYIVTAHSANDQAETVLMNVVRGAGVRGLSGIPAKRKLGNAHIIRPWLAVTRDEIEIYLKENNLNAVHDESNEEFAFTRNRVRHLVMPALDAAFPERSPVRALSALARRMSELSAFLTALTDEKLELLIFADNSISLEGLKHLHGQQLHAILEAWLARAEHRYRITESELQKIEKFLHSNDKHVELRHGIVLRKHEQYVVIESR